MRRRVELVRRSDYRRDSGGKTDQGPRDVDGTHETMACEVGDA